MLRKIRQLLDGQPQGDLYRDRRHDERWKNPVSLRICGVLHRFVCRGARRRVHRQIDWPDHQVYGSRIRWDSAWRLHQSAVVQLRSVPVSSRRIGAFACQRSTEQPPCFFRCSSVWRRSCCSSWRRTRSGKPRKSGPRVLKARRSSWPAMTSPRERSSPSVWSS